VFRVNYSNTRSLSRHTGQLTCPMSVVPSSSIFQPENDSFLLSKVGIISVVRLLSLPTRHIRMEY